MGRRVLEFKHAVFRHFAATGLVLLIGAGSAFAQSGTPSAQDQSKPAADKAAEVNKENQRKVDEFSEAAQAINGPAGNRRPSTARPEIRNASGSAAAWSA
jgi:uncharacterized protein (DUF2345 family)